MPIITSRLTPHLALATLGAVALLAGAASAQDHAAHTGASAAMTATLKAPDGTGKGSASITALPEGTRVVIEVNGITPGWHAVHFHQKGVCDDDKFANAGPHASKPGHTHGVESGEGPHAGDLPNLWVGADGIGKAEFFTPFMDKDTLTDTDGSALIVHAGVDDHKSQPAGNAGDRIACGVVTTH